MQELFTAVFDQCAKTTWSKGIMLVRADAVSCDLKDCEEIRLRVTELGVARKVVLWPEETDWQCDCNGEDPCPHIAAAVIALKRATEGDHEISPPTAARLLYSIEARDGTLDFQRVIEADGERQVLSIPLKSTGNANALMRRLAPTQEDWAIEQALYPKRYGVLDRATWKRLFAVFPKVESDRILFSGEPVEALRRPLRPELMLEDGPGPRDIQLKPAKNPDLLQLFHPGIARTSRGLALFQEPDLTPHLAALAKSGRVFTPREFGTLVSDILPALSPHFEIQNRTTRLPTEVRATVRISFNLVNAAEGIKITPELAYGEPKIALVRRHELISLGTEVPKRDLDREHQLASRLQQEFGLELDRTSVKPYAEVLALIVAARDLPSWVAPMSESDWQIHGKLVPEVCFQGEQLNLMFATSTGHGSSAVDNAAVFDAYRHGQSLVPLAGGGFAELPTSWLAQHGAAILDLLQSNLSPVTARAAWPQTVKLARELGLTPPPTLDALVERLAHPQGYEPPSGFAATLRPYQREAVEVLAQLRAAELGALLADDMGLGKTVQTIAILQGLTLIVAPTSVLFNWRSEIKRFYPQTEVILWHGDQRPELPRTASQVPLVVLTSYSLLRLEEAKLTAIDWDMAVLDEAHAIKNADSQTAQAAYKIQARFRLALTGTPIENRLSDLHSQFRFLIPGFLGTAREFRESYILPIQEGNSDTAARLTQKVKPFVIRRLKREVAKELPPCTEQNLYIELSTKERDLYQTIHAACTRDIVAQLNAGATPLMALEALLRLRQAPCHPALIELGRKKFAVTNPENGSQLAAPDEELSLGEQTSVSSKLDALTEHLIILADEGQKALVFSQWTSFLDLIGERLNGLGLGYLRLDGSTVDRGSIVSQFQNETSPLILLMSLKAGGVGLNLTAADHVFIMDPWWNPASENQAIGRAHRIGQTKPVMVYRLIAQGTIEEKIEALKQTKTRLAEDIITEGAALNAQEILGLLLQT